MPASQSPCCSPVLLGQKCGAPRAPQIPKSEAERTIPDLLCVPPPFAQRPRTAAVPKLAVPKPVNLPSMKKVSAEKPGLNRSGNSLTVAVSLVQTQEHAGNDPSTQIVPSGTGSGGWSKPEEPAPPPQPEAPPRPSAITTSGSSWANAAQTSQQQRPAPPTAFQQQQGAAWVAATAGPLGLKPSYPVDRHLNPEEYPSLAATARAAQSSKQSGGKTGFDQQQVRPQLPPPSASTRTSTAHPLSAIHLARDDEDDDDVDDDDDDPPTPLPA